jgi:single-strand DNA-binding protein
MYSSLNSVLLEGNLVRDPEVRDLEAGKTVCKLSVASNSYYKKDDETHQEVSYFDVDAWGTLAKNCAQYLEKGRGVRVIGRLKQDRWHDADGKGRSRVKIIAKHVEFKPRPKQSDPEPEPASERLLEVV